MSPNAPPRQHQYYPPYGGTPPRRKRTIGWVFLTISMVCAFALFGIAMLAMFPKWPSLLPSAPHYETAPTPCKSVSQDLLNATFQVNQPRTPELSDESTTSGDRKVCKWVPYKDQADALGRYSYLNVEVATHLESNGRPDFESVGDDFRYLQQSNPAVLRGLGDRAVATHEEDEVTIVASRANLTVKVTYNSVTMEPPHREIPISTAQLDGEAQQVVQQVLTSAGDPK